MTKNLARLRASLLRNQGNRAAMPSPMRPAAAAASTDSKEFILRSQGEDGYVEVSPTATLADVRLLVIDEFDPEQLPCTSADDGSGDEKVEFAFRVDGIRISAKQEGRKNAFELLEKGAKVELVPKKQQLKRALDEDDHRSAKRAKLGEGAGTVTPFEPAPEARAESDEAGGEDDTSTIDTGSAAGSVMAPVQLDDKFAAKDGNAKEGEGKASDGSDLYDSEATIELDGKKVAALEGDQEEIGNVANGTAQDAQVMEKCRAKSDGHDFDPMVNSGEEKSPAETEIETEMKDDDDALEEMTTDGKKKADPLDGIDDVSFSGNSGSDCFANDDVLEVSNQEESNNPHEEFGLAKDKSNQVLSQLAAMLKNNPDFCSGSRQNEWLEDIQNLTEKSSPQTVFGVLGNTGVGKSSLLNGLLDEAAVLPTSGSRGCTAAVVELVFHSDLIKTKETNEDQNTDDQATIPVYKGEVEFITLDDWRKELRTLVDECSTQEKTVYARRPEEDQMPDAAQAWQKIEQVYGKRSMEEYCTKSSDYVFHRLANDMRVKNLLTSTIPGQAYNSKFVEVGEVVAGSDEAKELLKGHGQMKSRTKGKKKKWAQEFRQRINSYVYRMGNGDQPQTWPLIRKVQLKGPWSVLSTGAVLVDLPGVRDSNAARAKVAESYLQNCNQIAIVAPIKRAVDDGTAKELLGEQFKRRLLMDGNYGNVFFICTQTDDIEATETMRDHSDIAQQVEGRWERMNELADGISGFEAQLHPLLQQEEGLEEQVEDAKQQYKESMDDLKQAEEDANEDSDYDDDDAGLVENLKAVIADNKTAFTKAKQDLASWKEEHAPTMDAIQSKCDRLQKKLKALCSNVRNEYSKGCLQADFNSGLKELYRKDDDDDQGDTDEQAALPEDFEMDVFCISANDYLKIMKIKPTRDGPPSCFSNAKDTQIPQLRQFVHETTARFCQSSVKAFVEQTNDVLDQMKLVAADVEDVPSGRSAFRMKSSFESAMRDLGSKIDPIAADFKKVLDHKIQRSLASSLQTGAQKGSAVAMSTVNSWGSKNRRTKDDRRPDKNGLYYSTYNAVARRDGVYTSKSAGAVDFNQELCDPMEKEFSTEWQSVLDSTIRKLLREAEKKILELCTSAGQAFAQNLRSVGVDAARLSSMLNTANRSAITALKASFGQMATVAVNAQRDLSRELLPEVQQKMKSTYASVTTVERGTGTFMRMKHAMASNSQRAVRGMFDGAMKKLLAGIDSLIKQLKTMLGATSGVIGRSFNNVFSICWDDQQSQALISPEQQKKMRECRDALLPELNDLVKIQEEACAVLGIEREEVELDVMGVESLEQTLARRKEEAIKRGDMFDLCDSDTELAIQPKKGVKVKAEKKRGSGAAKPSAPVDDVIDLCDSDSDDDDEPTKPAASHPSRGRGIKEEAFL